MTRSIDSLIDAIKRSPLTGDGIDPSAALLLVAEVERLRSRLALSEAVCQLANRIHDDDHEATYDDYFEISDAIAAWRKGPA